MSSESPAARPPSGATNRALWPEFFGFGLGILFRPKQTWRRLAEQPPSVGHVIWPHVVVLTAARGIAEFIGLIVGGKPVFEAVATGLTSLATWFILVWIMAAVVLTIASARQGDADFGRAIRFSAYSLTPFFVVGVLGAMPFPYVSAIADVLVLPYAFYVSSVGVVPVLRVPDGKVAGTVGLLNGALLVGVVVLPIAVRLGLDALSRS